jgi:hypothetical protein
LEKKSYSFFGKKWEIVRNLNLTLKASFGFSVKIDLPNPSIIKREGFFFMMANKNAFKLLAKATNRVLTERISKENVSKSSLKYFKSVKWKDVVKFSGHVIYCENPHSR